MKKRNGNGSPRKKYEKPMLRVVSIAPGTQTLGIGCKLASGGGVSYDQPCVSLACAAAPGS